MQCTQNQEVSVGYPGTGVTGSCELPDWVLGYKMDSSIRAVCSFRHEVISLALTVIFSRYIFH